MRTGTLIVLSGPSGVGKDTVIDAWAARNPRVVRVVANSTRAPRPGEIDGVDYYFVSLDEFLRRVGEGEFLEHKQVHGNYYGTPFDQLERLLEAGKIAILKIDVQGALTAMQARPEATSIFLLPPDREELARRIVERGTDAPEAIKRRLDNALGELALADRYQHKIVNDDVERVVDELERLVGEG